MRREVPPEMTYTNQCPVCGKDTWHCYDNGEGECGNRKCRYHETSLGAMTMKDRIEVELLFRAYSEYTTQHNLAKTCSRCQSDISRTLSRLKRNGVPITYKLIHIRNARKRFRAYGIPLNERNRMLIHCLINYL